MISHADPHLHNGSQPQCGPILLAHAAQAFLTDLGRQMQFPKQERYHQMFASLERHLGPDAPLLAYTKVTGEAWRQTLCPSQHSDAQRFLDEFREYLRSFGWFDAARPVNQFD